MSEIIKKIIVWSYIILSAVAFVRIVIIGNCILDSIIGTLGIVVLDLSGLIIFMSNGD